MKQIMFLFLMGVQLTLKAQTITDTIARATEFSVPNSGALTLLGINPANVVTPGFTKDINLDYFVDKVSLRPDLAFEFQPFWLFGFKNISLDNYHNTSPILRFLGTTSVSIGTAQVNDTVNKIAYSARFSFRHDPMMDKSYTEGIDQIHIDAVKEREQRENEVSRIRFSLQKQNRNLERKKAELLKDSTGNADQVMEIERLIESNELQRSKLQTDLVSLLERAQQDLEERITDYAKNYIEANWHRPKMDIGIGKVDTYTDPKITTIRLRQNGYGFWINPSIGFVPGKWANKGADEAKSNKLLLTGIYRHIKLDDITQQFYGGNIRYGSSHLNLFVEYTYLKDDEEKTNTIAYGGSYQIGSKKLLEFGIRTNYDQDFTYKSLRPVISFNWIFGKDLLK